MRGKASFAERIVCSNEFLEMSGGAQLLYYTLGMHADDDGFVGSPKPIMRSISATNAELSELLQKKYIISFDDGVLAIRHWFVNNRIRKDTYIPSVHQNKKRLILAAGKGKEYQDPLDSLPQVNGSDKGENEVSQEIPPRKKVSSPLMVPSSSPPTTPLSLSPYNPPASQKDNPPQNARISSWVEESSGKETKSVHRKSYGEHGRVKLSQEEHDRLVRDYGQAEAERCIAYVDEIAQSTNNKPGWKDWNLVVRRCHRDGWGSKGQPAKAKTGNIFLEMLNERRQ
nr:MAG TPA: hypothetical protein [Caudoviricetes sp.]